MLVLEYMENGDLKHYLVRQRQEYVASVALYLFVCRVTYGFVDRGNEQCCLLGFRETLLKMCRDIASGMEYLSRKSFVHRVSTDTTRV